MKKTLLFVRLLVALAFSATTSRADTQVQLVEKYYKAFNMIGGEDNGRLTVALAMDKEVPRAGRDDFYATLIDRAASEPDGEGAVVYVLDVLDSRETTFKWNQRLKKSVLAQAKNKSVLVRSDIARLLCRHDRVECRELCLSYLDDSDDHVRYSALSAMCQWPDASTIVTKYLQDHRTSQEHAKSIEVARVFVEGDPPPAQ